MAANSFRYLITILSVIVCCMFQAQGIFCRAFAILSIRHQCRQHVCKSFASRSGSNNSNNNKNDKTMLSRKDDRWPESDKAYTTLRKECIDASLHNLQVNATMLHDAALTTIEDPQRGYDGQFGKSAIKAYRSFVFSDTSTNYTTTQQWQAAADRCARHIDFLLKRHQAHQADWIRHHDTQGIVGNSERKYFPVILLLDNLRSAFNVGSLYRTADATACEAIFSTGITPHPGGNGAEKLQKASLGAELLIPNQHFTTTWEAIVHIRHNYPEYTIIGMETTMRSVNYTAYAYPSNGVVLVLGNEVTGVDPSILSDDAALDAIVEIPMFGQKNSLNVASCAPIVLYEILRQWKV